MRNFPNSPSLNISSTSRPPKVELVIVCEGANTEPAYFRECAKHYGAGTIRLKLITAAGVPLTLVKAAIHEKKTLTEQRNKSKDSFDSCFRVWAVFDRDVHPHIPEAMELAKRYRIDVAFSNPCFELWPILHLEDFGSQFGRHALQSHLKSLMPSYNHQNGALIDFELISSNFSDAYIRSRKHNADREKEGSRFGNPSTTVGVLVRKIIENGKHSNKSLLTMLDKLPPNLSPSTV